MNIIEKNIEIITSILISFENTGLYDSLLNEDNKLIANLIFGLIKKTDKIFKLKNIDIKDYDNGGVIIDRINTLKHFKIINQTKDIVKITKRAHEFYKHEDKEYFIYKLGFLDIINNSKYPFFGLNTSRALIQLSESDFKYLRLQYECSYNGKKISDNDIKNIDSAYMKFDKIFEGLKNDIPENSSISYHRFFKPQSVGRYSLLMIPQNFQKRILNELDETIPETKEKDSNYLSIDNILESHIEQIVRRNFVRFFPNYNIIDNNKQYFTSKGNFIDILARNNKNSELLIIELKRDLSPQKALVQLLDYVNQVSIDFKEENVKGILLCRDIDSRTKSAVGALKMKLKNPDDIEIMKFDLTLKIN
jgi:hypothetical protein